MRVKPVEGDIAVLSDGSVWIVKGCIHPADGIIAMPRFVGGRRLKKVGESFHIVRRYYRHYMRYVEGIGHEVPVIPWRDVRRYFSARERTAEIACGEGVALPKHVAEAINLIRVLSKSCDLTCWLTGSALGLYPSSGQGPDADVLCLDSAYALECIRRLRAEGVLSSLRPSEFLSEAFAVGEVLSPRTLVRLATRRLTQGSFNGVRYTLRLINCERITHVTGPYDLVLHAHEVAVLLKNSDYRFPAIYEARLLSPLMGIRDALLVTHRVRLTELPAGTLILGSAVLYLPSAERRFWVINFDMPPSHVNALYLNDSQVQANP